MDKAHIAIIFIVLMFHPSPIHGPHRRRSAAITVRRMTPFPRPLFSPEHDAFRAQVRRFCEREIAPHHAAWEEAHGVPRALWRQAGANGLLCCWLPESLGGPGADLLFDFIVGEELGRIGATGPGFALHSVIVAPYLAAHGTPESQRALLPAMVRGEKIAAIAMTEPGTGSGSPWCGLVTRSRRRVVLRNGRAGQA